MKIKKIVWLIWHLDVVPVSENWKTDPLLEFIEKVRKNSLNVVPFWSDISQTSQLWIPSVNFWPWSIEQAHTDNEFLLKKSFEKTYEQFRNYIFN